MDSNHHETSTYLIKRLFAEHIGNHIKMLLIAVICMVIVAATTATHAWMLQPVLDKIFLEKDSTMLMVLPIAVIIIAIIKGIASYFQSVIMKCVSQRILTDMQLKLYHHLLYADLSMFAKEGAGKLVSRFTNDITTMRGSITIVTTGFTREFLTLVGLIALMFYQNFTLSVIAFAAFPIAIYPIMRLGKKMRRVSRKTQEQLGDFTGTLDENFQGIRVIKAYGREEFETLRAKKFLDGIYKLYSKAAKTEAASSPLMETLGGVAIASVIWYGGSQIMKGQTTPGEFTSVIAAILMAYKPMKSLSSLNTSLQEGLAAANRVFNLMDILPSIKNSPDASILKLDQKGGNIKFSNVHFSYNEEKKVLKNLNLEVPQGKTVALVGSSGGGKSTILNLLLRFYEISDGSITINDHDIRSVTMESLRGNMAFVSQDIVLFDDTIAANIAYGNLDASREEIIEAAKNAAADDFIEELPQKYDTIIGTNGLSLSGGQRQRIAIARAMLRNAPILLLDEATSALDQVSEKKIQKALEKLMQNRTTIVIAHRLSTVIHSDIIYVIKKGTVAESGKHSDLIEKNGEYAKLYKGLAE